MDFNANHGSAIKSGPKELSVDDMLSINQRCIGGGMSQNYAALYFFEYFIRDNGIRCFIEIGTQKGALSLYLANMAAVTEQFVFVTTDISHFDLYDRSVEGVGAWLEQISRQHERYIWTYNYDCFGIEFLSLVKDTWIADDSLHPMVVFCDGGDKIREFKTFSKMVRSGDFVIVHDWGDEITFKDISDLTATGMMKNFSPWDRWAGELRTKLMPFQKI